MVVFVTSASATACGTFGGLNQTAVGAYCYRDQYDRPIALNVNICPGTLQLASAGDLTSQRRDDLVAALVRALLQGLGADHALLPYFRDPVTNAPLVSRDANNEPTGATAAVYFQGVSGDGSTRVTVRDGLGSYFLFCALFYGCLFVRVPPTRPSETVT